VATSNVIGFLGELFGVSWIAETAAEKAIDRLFVPAEKFVESFGRAEREVEHEALVGRCGMRGRWVSGCVVHGTRKNMRV
jgi:hypothetical protein